jgi:soluble lytic murein transglycosylase
LLPLLLLHVPDRAHRCVPAAEDRLLEASQLSAIRSATTADAAWTAVAPRPDDPRVHPSVWSEIATRFPGRLHRSLLTLGADSDPGLALATRLGEAEVARRLGWRAGTERATRLLEAHRNEAADAAADAVLALDPPPGAACQLAYVRGKAARKLRRYRSALRRLREAADACWGVDDETGLKATLLEARVARIRGRTSTLRAAARTIERRAGQHRYWDDATFLEGDLLQHRGHAGAAAVYASILERAPDSDHAPEAAWRLAQMATGRKAVARLRRLKALPHPSARSRDRAAYWLADALAAVGSSSVAHALWTELALGYGYYGRLALDRLPPTPRDAVVHQLSRVATATAADPAPDALARVLASDQGRAAKALAAAGRPLDAGVVLRGWACAAPRTPGDRLAAAAWLHRHDAVADAQRVIRPAQEALLSVPLTVDSLAALRLAYSSPYRPLVEAAARAEGLDPWLLLALAREESTFDPDIVSWAGAHGLTQLMPGTARGAHRAVFRRPLPDLAALAEPALNLRLGAHVLAEGMARFRAAPLALAAYNAGPGLTVGFLRDGGGRFDRFVESISVKQTRGYVMRVTETWARYRLLYDREAPIVSLPRRVPVRDPG